MFLDEAPADEGAGQDEQGRVDVSTAFVADQQTTEAMEPSYRALDDPAHLAKSLALASASNHRPDAPLSASRAASSRIIGLVSVKTSGPFPRPSARNRNGRHRIQKGLQHATVMDVGSGEQDRQRQALLVGQQTVF